MRKVLVQYKKSKSWEPETKYSGRGYMHMYIKVQRTKSKMIVFLSNDDIKNGDTFTNL